MHILRVLPYPIVLILLVISPLLISAQHDSLSSHEIGHHDISYLHGRGRRHRLLAAKLNPKAASLTRSVNDTSVHHPESDAPQSKRGGSRFTFYQTGMGACGKYNSNVDYVVALNAEQWAGGSHCFETITITCNGKKTEAQITDLCSSCPPGALDMSPGLFSFFADQSQGMAFGDWHFGNDQPKPTPTPTRTSETLTPSRTKLPLSTLHTQHRAVSITQSKETTSSAENLLGLTTQTAPIPTPISSLPANDESNLADFNTLLLDMGALVSTAAADVGHQSS